MALVDPALHQYPMLHAAVHREDVWPEVAPYLPAGHCVHEPLIK